MVRIVASLILYTSERSNLFSETTQCPFKLILTKGQFKTLSVEASPLGRCRRLVVFLRPVWVLGVNYSSLYVALETEQLFGEQLIQATPRFEMRCHKYTHMRFAARRGEVRGGRHFRDLKVAETRCLFSDIKKTVWYSLRRDLWKMEYYQSGNVTVAAAEMRIHNAAGNERWRWIKEQWQYNTVDKSCCNFSGVWEWKSQFCLGLFENWKKKKKEHQIHLKGPWHLSCARRALTEDQPQLLLRAACQMPPWIRHSERWWLSGQCRGYFWPRRITCQTPQSESQWAVLHHTLSLTSPLRMGFGQ